MFAIVNFRATAALRNRMWQAKAHNLQGRPLQCTCSSSPCAIRSLNRGPKREEKASCSEPISRRPIHSSLHKMLRLPASPPSPPKRCQAREGERKSSRVENTRLAEASTIVWGSRLAATKARLKQCSREGSKTANTAWQLGSLVLVRSSLTFGSISKTSASAAAENWRPKPGRTKKLCRGCRKY